MTFSSNKSLNILCIIGYLLFMTLAFDSSMVDALVFYVTEQNGQVTLKPGKIHVRPVSNKTGSIKMVAVQYQSDKESPHPAGTATIALLPSDSLILESHDASHSGYIEMPATTTSFTAPAASEMCAATSDDDDEEANDGEEERAESATTSIPLPAQLAVRKDLQPILASSAMLSPLSNTMKPAEVQKIFSSISGTENRFQNLAAPQTTTTTTAAVTGPKTISIVSLIKALPERRWEYDPAIDRYIVRYDSKTTLVLTLKPTLQKLVENVFEQYKCKLGAAVIQDPATGAILALTSFDGHRVLSPEQPDFVENNWALKATFPVASIFKIITAAAGIEKGKVAPASRIRIGKRASLELWQAFAKSHNGVFGVVGRAVGQRLLQWYANSFGFNKPFYFDLPVSTSVAQLPENSLKLGQAAAGLNKYFEVSPMHVASIVSTVLNKGKWMKPFLVDYVMYDGKVIFRRKPFQLAQPISVSAASQIHEMMRTTTTHGTGKRGFNAYADCPSLASVCGGKTGTLTGANPAYLFTWFGGFTHIAGQDLGMVVLVGQGGHVKATTLAGKISHELLAGRVSRPERLTRR